MSTEDVTNRSRVRFGADKTQSLAEARHRLFAAAALLAYSDVELVDQALLLTDQARGLLVDEVEVVNAA